MLDDIHQERTGFFKPLLNCKVSRAYNLHFRDHLTEAIELASIANAKKRFRYF